MIDKSLTPGKKLRLYGAEQCSEKELLSIIINNGTKSNSADEIAEKILDKYGTVYYLQGKTLAELMEIKGIGPVKATQFAAIYELFRRLIRHIERES